MEQFQTETAQNISIHQNTAHLGERMLAYVIINDYSYYTQQL